MAPRSLRKMAVISSSTGPRRASSTMSSSFMRVRSFPAVTPASSRSAAALVRSNGSGATSGSAPHIATGNGAESGRALPSSTSSITRDQSSAMASACRTFLSVNGLRRQFQATRLKRVSSTVPVSYLSRNSGVCATPLQWSGPTSAKSRLPRVILFSSSVDATSSTSSNIESRYGRPAQ